MIKPSALRGLDADRAMSALRERGFILRDGFLHGLRLDAQLFLQCTTGGYALASCIREFAAPGGSPLSLDPECVEFYREFGFIPPPFTLYRDVYSLAPYLGLRLGGARPEFRPEYPAPAPSGALRLADELPVYLRGALAECAGPIGVAFSGGADSAVLLAALRESIGPERIIAITRVMTGLDAELARARRICSDLGVRMIEVSGDPDARRTADTFMDETFEPLCDEAVPLLRHLIGLGLRAVPEMRCVLDGQGADSLFMGLPHNRLISLHRRIAPVRPLLRLARPMIKRQGRGGTGLARLMYRASKVAASVVHSDPLDALVESLRMRGGPLEGNAVLGYMRGELDLVWRRYGSLHRAASYLFMFRILAAREMQKYRLPFEGVRLVLPFIDPSLIERVFSLDESGLVRGGTYKKPIYDAAEAFFGGLFRGVSTAPFYVKYDLAPDGGTMQDYCIDHIRALIEEGGPR